MKIRGWYEKRCKGKGSLEITLEHEGLSRQEYRKMQQRLKEIDTRYHEQKLEKERIDRIMTTITNSQKTIKEEIRQYAKLLKSIHK